MNNQADYHTLIAILLNKYKKKNSLNMGLSYSSSLM